jgi:hypothetical protein
MKIKYVLIIYCILALAGVALPLFQGQAWAQIDLRDKICTPEEKMENLCFEMPEWGYAVSAFYPNQDGVADPIHHSPPLWPIDGKTYQYIGYVTDATKCKSLTWNYWVIRLSAIESGAPVDYIESTVPPGAQLLIPGQSVPKCTNFTAKSGEALLKLNPGLNCFSGNQTIFSITVKEGTPTTMWNNSVITTKLGCIGGDKLIGPGYAVPGYIDHREFHCGDDLIVVYYDKFSGQAINVEMSYPNGNSGYTAYEVCETTVGDLNYPQLIQEGYEPYPPERFGPGGIGAMFCMDPPPPLYFYNNRAWYGSLTGCP